MTTYYVKFEEGIDSEQVFPTVAPLSRFQIATDLVEALQDIIHADEKNLGRVLTDEEETYVIDWVLNRLTTSLCEEYAQAIGEIEMDFLGQDIYTHEEAHDRTYAFQKEFLDSVGFRSDEECRTL